VGLDEIGQLPEFSSVSQKPRDQRRRIVKRNRSRAWQQALGLERVTRRAMRRSDSVVDVLQGHVDVGTIFARPDVSIRTSST